MGILINLFNKTMKRIPYKTDQNNPQVPHKHELVTTQMGYGNSQYIGGVFYPYAKLATSTFCKKCSYKKVAVTPLHQILNI